MHILITGGAGFIGSHLVDNLLAETAEKSNRITVIDNFDDFYSPEIKRANLKRHQYNPDFQLYEIDIRSQAKLETVFKAETFDVIVHLAAKAGVRPSLVDPLSYVETNVCGTLNLLEMARKYGIPQFVFASSSSVYGVNSEVPFSESQKITKPISPYAATKAVGELLCSTYSHLHPIRTICLRLFTVYGARQRPDLAIHKFARLIKNNQPISVFGDGTSRRDYTYIDDIIQGIKAAIVYQNSDHEAFNLGESRTVELRYLIELLENSLGTKAKIHHLPPQPGDVPITYADLTKAKTALNYNPQIQIEEGIKRFAQWLENENNDFPAVENKRKINKVSMTSGFSGNRLF
jgi:UDP-glucuronate 4-epimerase